MTAVHRNQPDPSQPTGTFLGFPLDGFGFLTSFLLAASSGFFAFFFVTAVAIFGLLGWNLFGNHTASYTLSYKAFGLPVAAVVWTVAFIVFGSLWLRARLKQMQK
jgi:hypothetical protein